MEYLSGHRAKKRLDSRHRKAQEEGNIMGEEDEEEGRRRREYIVDEIGPEREQRGEKLKGVVFVR